MQASILRAPSWSDYARDHIITAVSFTEYDKDKSCPLSWLTIAFSWLWVNENNNDNNNNNDLASTYSLHRYKTTTPMPLNQIVSNSILGVVDGKGFHLETGGTIDQSMNRIGLFYSERVYEPLNSTDLVIQQMDISNTELHCCFFNKSGQCFNLICQTQRLSTSNIIFLIKFFWHNSWIF